MSTAERAAFLDATLAAQIRAERALHNGDLAPRLATWSQDDPVTLVGAAVPCRRGWAAVLPVFEWLARTFTTCDEYDFELIAADADRDLAYTVGIERYRATTSTGATVHNTLRVTHVYRREDDEWRMSQADLAFWHKGLCVRAPGNAESGAANRAACRFARLAATCFGFSVRRSARTGTARES